VRAGVDVQAVLAGDRRALARALTEVENDTPEGRLALDAFFKHSGKAHLVGVTGSPGAGKSSLVNQIALHLRHPQLGEPLKIAIVAVDPSSPFTGGALLGDRVRMRDLAGDSGVFIRSMASRGTLGGLARSTSALARVLDAAGYDLVLIETVGAGQSEVDIARLAHTTIVVEAPGMGDDIQAIKAGILEIADILVVNKADQPMADNAERALKAMLDLAHPQQHSAFERLHHRQLAFEPVLSVLPVDADPSPAEMWAPPVLRTISTQGEGIEAVVTAIKDHAIYLRQHGEWQQREAARLQEELNELLLAALAAQWRERVDKGNIQRVVQAVLNREYSPYQALQILLKF